MNVKEKQTVFHLRTRMINVKENFKNGHKDNPWCRTCSLFIENQKHILNCTKTLSKLEPNERSEEIQYEYIFGNLQQQEEIFKYYTKLLEIRQDIIENQQQN